MTWSKAASTAVVALFAITSAAQQTTTTQTTTTVPPEEKWISFDKGAERTWCQFKGNEFNISVFGTGTAGDETIVRNNNPRRIERDDEYGGGLGFQYFPVRYLGVEGYGYTESTSHNWVDNVGGNLILRLPIKNWGIAPYVFGGGGRQLDPIYQWYLDAGGGLEWRFLGHMGVFADARYVWPGDTEDYGLGRIGLRFGW